MRRVDKKELEEAVEKYSDAMLRCAWAYCGNMADAEDVVQEAFVRYIRKAPTFNEEQHRRAWLLRVTINLSKSLRMSFWNRNRRDMSEELPVSGENVGQEQLEVWSAVEQLPPKYKIIMELYYREGLTVSEIAQITGVRRSTVGYRLERARELFKEIYKEE